MKRLFQLLFGPPRGTFVLSLGELRAIGATQRLAMQADLRELRLSRSHPPSERGQQRTAGKTPGEEIPDAHAGTMRKLQQEFRPSASDQNDLRSALVNLGCKPQKAAEVAGKALSHGPDFDGQLRWALQNVGNR